LLTLKHMKLVFINIVNKDQKIYLKQCIDSVLRQTYSNLDTIIIDNNSTDGSQEFITRNFPHIKLIQNATNEGYAKAHNKAIGLCRGAYIMPLNVDIVLKENFVEEMVKAIEREDSVGMAQGKLCQMAVGGAKALDSTGVFLKKDRRNFDRGYGQPDLGQYDNIEYIFAPSGAAPLYKRMMLEDIKIEGEYFDEDFFMYREEVDLAWRAQLMGWKCIYTPLAVAYHMRGYSPSSRKSVPVTLRRLQYRNRYLMIVKNELPLLFLRHFIFILWFEMLQFLYCFFREPFLLAAWADITRLFPRALSKRRQIMQKQKVHDSYILELIK
jgi:GT2 family glycosyltransferase